MFLQKGFGDMLKKLQPKVDAFCKNVGQCVNFWGTSHAGKTHLLKLLLKKLCDELLSEDQVNQDDECHFVITFHHQKKLHRHKRPLNDLPFGTFQTFPAVIQMEAHPAFASNPVQLVGAKRNFF